MRRFPPPLNFVLPSHLCPSCPPFVPLSFWVCWVSLSVRRSSRTWLAGVLPQLGPVCFRAWSPILPVLLVRTVCSLRIGVYFRFPLLLLRSIGTFFEFCAAYVFLLAFVRGEWDLVDPFPGERPFVGPRVLSLSHSFRHVQTCSQPVLSPSRIVLSFVVLRASSNCPAVVLLRVPRLALV